MTNFQNFCVNGLKEMTKRIMKQPYSSKSKADIQPG
jgi:hypothetical protein